MSRALRHPLRLVSSAAAALVTLALAPSPAHALSLFAKPDVLESVDLRLGEVSAAGAAWRPDSRAPGWSRATPLLELSPDGAAPVAEQAVALLTEFAAEHHLVARPAHPPNPRRLD